PLAGGRVYTGKEALDIGLIDRLGGFADAIKHAAGEADLGNDYEVKVFPKPKTIMDILAEAFGGKKEKDDFIRMARSGTGFSGLASLPAVTGALDTIRKVDPQKARCIENFLIQVELLARESVLLIGPESAIRLP